MLKKGWVNVQTIHESATRLLAEAHFKTEAAHIGDSLCSAGDMVWAADEIESLLRKLGRSF